MLLEIGLVSEEAKDVSLAHGPEQNVGLTQNVWKVNALWDLLQVEQCPCY